MRCWAAVMTASTRSEPSSKPSTWLTVSKSCPPRRCGWSVDDPSLNGQANLVWRAVESLAQHGKVQPRAHIWIQKRIPTGMGLGGASSDAAAALIALNQLWGLGMTTEDLALVAAGLGSDVPFFLWGGTALAQGRGEQITPLPPLPPVPVTLVCPRTTLPNKTASMYACLTPAHFSDGGVTRRIV